MTIISSAHLHAAHVDMLAWLCSLPQASTGCASSTLLCMQVAFLNVWAHRTVQFVEDKDATPADRDAKQHIKAAVLIHSQLPLAVDNIVTWGCDQCWYTARVCWHISTACSVAMSATWACLRACFACLPAKRCASPCSEFSLRKAACAP